ncbi:MAG TPA: hypothetical protein VF271_05800 [Rhodanobacteraceae bacterium]
MNFAFLPYGPLGVALDALISLAAGIILFGPFHWWGRREHWSHARTIGWTWVATMLATASIDSWNLFYMGVVSMQSPVTAARVIDSIHDADTLGMRVTCEFIGACAGVMIGWLLWTRAWRKTPAGHDA